MTAPRIIVAGATTAITRRTTLRKAFLAPWHPLVPKVWLYALADAQRRTAVDVHHGICVITHHHITVTPQSDNLPEFTQLLHRDVSCALNTLLAHERYDAPREVFDGRSAHYMRLLDAPAQASQLVYEHNNSVAAGLVSRPEHMPGSIFDFHLWKTGYLDVERPPVYFGDDRPEVIRLHVTPPPLLLAAFGGDLDWLIYHMQRESEHAARTLRAVRRRPPLGARRIERLHPWSEPRTLHESGGTRVPTFRLGARGLLGQQTTVAAALETREFRHEHERVRCLHRAGDRAHHFPYGTYAMRVRHGAPVAQEPYLGALVTRPGPFLCDLQAEIDAGRSPHARSELHEQAVQLLDDVRNAVVEERIELYEHENLDFGHGEGTDPAARTRIDRNAVDDDKTAILVRHRFDQPPAESDARSARRMILLRDRRRGRPTGSPRHGTDPPA